MKPKSLDGLMEYMRDTKGIFIEESQKRNLRNIGYFMDIRDTDIKELRKMY